MSAAITCPQVSDEGLICSLVRGHIGDMHKDLSDPTTEIQWWHPRAIIDARQLPLARSITLGELVSDVDDRVRARAAALLAQAPARPQALGQEPTFAITDEVPEPAHTEGAIDLPALVAPVRPPGVFADVLRTFFLGRRASRARADQGNP